jgi:hypothetical protein
LGGDCWLAAAHVSYAKEIDRQIDRQIERESDATPSVATFVSSDGEVVFQDINMPEGCVPSP